MTALNANKNDNFKVNSEVQKYGVSGAVLQIFQQALINRNVSGYAVPASDTVDEIFLGFSYDELNQTGIVADGTNIINVHTKGSGVTLICKTNWVATVADIGELVYVLDDQTVQLAGNVKVGYIENIISTSEVEVRFAD